MKLYSNHAYFVLLVFACFLSSCNIFFQPAQEKITHFNSGPTPEFIMRVNPLIISNSDYRNSLDEEFLIMGRGIVVMINNLHLDLSPSNFNVTTIQDRSSLFVNDDLVSNELLLIADGIEGDGGPYYLSWAVNLHPGEHLARFEFISDYGETLSFEWRLLVEK